MLRCHISSHSLKCTLFVLFLSTAFFKRFRFRVYDKKVTLSGKVAHAAVRAAALNEERLREA